MDSSQFVSRISYVVLGSGKSGQTPERTPGKTEVKTITLCPLVGQNWTSLLSI